MTGFDPVYGARPLRRLIQSAIGDQLARQLLAGEITDGDTVLVDLDPAADALAVRPARKNGPVSALRADQRSGVVQQLVVPVLGKPEIIADPEAEAQEHP